MSTGRPPGKVSSSLPWWQTYAKSPEREKKKQEGGRWNKCSMTRGYRYTIYPEYPEEAPQLPQPHMDVEKQKLSHSPLLFNRTCLDVQARSVSWVSNRSMRFMEIDIVTEFEWTSLGLARLGEWASRMTSSDMVPINNSTSVKRATTTVDDGCMKTVEEKGHPER
ncbi:hypothetical protein BU17DRAFT_69665 [Hysterangium stoloniferum]|nr:hypothetical protein BU17DRAFT_69665 [Hysterangium stoloniferum]